MCTKRLRSALSTFFPQINVTVERHKFNSRQQEEDEPFEKFLTDLKRLFVNCDFCSLKDSHQRQISGEDSAR